MANKKSNNKKKKNAKNQKKQRELLLSLLLLLAASIFLGTASYAWFTANQKVKVSSIDVNVSTSSGIQISADGSNWKSVLVNTDLSGASATYPAAINQLPQQLEPVSSAGIVDSSGKMEMFLGNVVANETTGDFILSATQSVETNTTESGKFIAFDIFLKNENDETLYLTNESKVTFRNSDTGIKNATRIAFVVLGHTTTSDTAANIRALNAGTSSDVIIWEPNYDVHTDNGVANAVSPYGINTLNVGSGNAWVPYSGVKAAVPSSANIKREQATQTLNSTYFQDVDPTIKTVENYTDYQTLLADGGLEAGITKIRVYMWVEGQDVDCENNASGGEIRFDLQFSIVDSSDSSTQSQSQSS